MTIVIIVFQMNKPIIKKSCEKTSIKNTEKPEKQIKKSIEKKTEKKTEVTYSHNFEDIIKINRDKKHKIDENKNSILKSKKNDDSDQSSDEEFKESRRKKSIKKNTVFDADFVNKSIKNSSNSNDTSSIKVLDRDELRLNKLKKFYKNKYNLETFVNIVTGNFPKKNLSLRILDWFVTNYSKEKDVIIKYKNEKDSSVISFDVHNEYKNQLTAFGKKGYDQFCRSGKIFYPYKEDGVKKYVETTIAQLNFFKWAITEKIINYVVKHFDEIFKHMNNAKKKRDAEKNKSDDEKYDSDSDNVSDIKSSKKKSIDNCSSSMVEYSLETELSTPVENVNILEFSSSKPKLEKYMKTTRRSRHEFAKTKAKQLNKCTGKINIEFK